MAEWQQVKEIFGDALEIAPENRASFLDKVCAGDESLRREVESLLSSSENVSDFMEQAAIGKVAEMFDEAENKKQISGRFNHYEIIKQIGAGGMGEVYLAEDTKLDRKVAVKVLNEKFAAHESNIQRFVKEAKAASSLNHPNILVIHEIGESEGAQYIVSEYVEGKTLRQSIKEKTLSFAEILDIAIQIANALAAAHSAHIIHRDIKPENVIIRPDGLAKILDFGLAKLVARKHQSLIGLEDGTLRQNDTAKGIILGTVNYMSPEQAKGEQIDERTDIFSLGAVIYEMIAGRTPFSGNTMSETFANLINAELLPLSRYTANVPGELQRVIAKTLKKNKDERYQTMKDVLADLKNLRENLVPGECPGKLHPPETENATERFWAATSDTNNQAAVTHYSFSQEKSKKRIWLLATPAIFLIGFVMVATGFLFNFSGAKVGNTLSFEQMRQFRLTQSGDVYAPFISPDGKYLAYMKLDGAKRGVRLLQITTGSVLELVPPRPKIQFWSFAFSPDSNYLYYVEYKENDLSVLYRIPSLGGQPQKLADFISGNLTVSPDGNRIAFKRINKQAGFTSIIVVNNDGSNERTIAEIDTDSDYWSLDWSPDGSTIAYAVKRHEPKNDSWYVAEIPAGGGAERRIGEPHNSQIITARWLPDKKGLILNAVDAKTRLPQIYYLSYPDGAERRITNDLNDYTGLSITADGKSIVSQRIEQDRQIWILPDDNPRQAKQLTSKKAQHSNAVSWLTNDTLIFDADENGNYQNHNIWRMKIGEGEPQRLTTGADDNFSPVASPDGSLIAFVSRRSGKRQIWRMNADGTRPTQLTNLDYETYDPQFSPDGQMIYFQRSVGGEERLMRVSVNGGEAVSLSDTGIQSWTISPDGKKLAYVCLDRDTQKFVTRIRPIDEDRTEQTLNIDPDRYLQWSKDGQALYFTLEADEAKNIWRQSLSESKPRQVTAFDKENISSFAFSPDGKNLACLRVTVAFDAVMLKFDE